jgi:hypothetical protein
MLDVREEPGWQERRNVQRGRAHDL